MRRSTTEIIVLCDECESITTGEAWEASPQTRDDPAEWAARCECGSDEFYDLEDAFSESIAKRLLSEYEELADSSEYEDRLKAEGFIKALEVLI